MRIREAMRAVYLGSMGFLLMTVGSVVMLLVSVLTLFRARRFCQEFIGKWVTRFILNLSGVRLEIHRSQPFPVTQSIYTANHTTLLDLYILCALGLPNTRYFMIRGCWRIPPLYLMAVLMGTFLTPPQERRDLRVKCFQRACRALRETGDSAYLSPEGQRVRTGGVGPFNKGTFHLATSLKAPIVPLYIQIPPQLECSTNVYILPGTIRVFVLPAIPTANWKLEDLERNRDYVRNVYLEFERNLTGRLDEPGRELIASRDRSESIPIKQAV